MNSPATSESVSLEKPDSKSDTKLKKSISADVLRQTVIAAIRTIYDPEIPVNIYDLGLIYGVDVDEEGNVSINMTLTTPSCPEAQTLPASVETTVDELPDVKSVKLSLVWDPPWDKDRMSEEVKMVLGIF